ncbi:hypothetical protein D6D04_10105 [Aureobasidium pullulans]|nr:hypothetical protein D6D04_10105 [Aureobasidium pullulans]
MTPRLAQSTFHRYKTEICTSDCRIHDFLLTIIWFSIGVTALAIVAPTSTNKYDVQTDLTTILARDSMAPSPETEHECMEACVDAAL